MQSLYERMISRWTSGESEGDMKYIPYAGLLDEQYEELSFDGYKRVSLIAKQDDSSFRGYREAPTGTQPPKIRVRFPKAKSTPRKQPRYVGIFAEESHAFVLFICPIDPKIRIEKGDSIEFTLDAQSIGI